ncbi:MAG: 16S rRNA (uracil(1498)-N(3))-methyltransferase [Labilithrix sp.]|nr:16S rRNA (uracil(1498)-N(3))-methyltransferase [Labilithrix sp.]
MIRAPIAALAPGVRALPSDVSHHLCRVLRLRIGDRFVAFDPEARVEADVTIDDVSGDAARVTVGALRPARVVAEAPVVFVYALAKGDKVDAVVRDATELGATRIIVARTSRSVVKAEGDRAAGKIDRWRRIAEQAARQCGRADPPAIEGILGWGAALEAAARESDARWCLWESATAPIGPALRDAVARAAPLAFAIGPEGGLTQAEVEEARVAGFAPASLGRFVLRTETVAAAILGAVLVLRSGDATS